MSGCRGKDTGREDSSGITGSNVVNVHSHARKDHYLSGKNALLRIVLLSVLLLFGFAEAKATEVGMENAFLDRIGFDKLADFADSSLGMDAFAVFKEILSGEWDPDIHDIRRILSECGSDIAESLFEGMAMILLPVILCILSRILLNRNAGTLGGIQLFCRVAVSAILVERYENTQNIALMLIGNIMDFSGIITPVMVTALSLTGAATTASVLSPLASLAGLGISYLMENVCLKLTCAGVVIAVVGNLSDSFRLKRLFDLIKTVIIWLTGILMAAFTGILSVQGLIGNSVDSAKLRGMQYTAESLIPIIGGEVSGSMDSLLSTSVLIKNSVGVTGLILLIVCCLEPLIKLAVFALSMKLCAAVIEPAADNCLVDTCAQFGDIAQMQMVICVGSMMLVILLIGAGLVTVGNIAV